MKNLNTKKYAAKNGARVKALLTSAAAIALLAACSVGPDFLRPAAPAAGFSHDPQPATTVAPGTAGDTAGGAQKFVSGAPVSDQWWTLFGSAPLNGIVDDALLHSPTLAAAEATLRQARENLYAQEGAIYPTVNGSVNFIRQKGTFGGDTPIPPYSLTTAQVSVSYGLDLFGELRRALEAQRATVEQIAFQTQAAYLTLTSNIVAAVVQDASLRAQIQATQSILDFEQQQLAVLRRQLDLGGIAEADVVTEATAVAQTQATLPPLQRQLAQNGHLLLALTGRYPSDALPGDAKGFDLATIRLPGQLPVSLPSQLVDQRPDVRASEAALHVASANVGVATAEMLPTLSLSGNYGSAANPLTNLFSPGTGIWSIGAGLTQPIFHGGQLLHQKRAAVAAYDLAAAQYRSTVLGAFQNVADVLRALETDADAVKAQEDAERNAAESLSIAQNSYQTGATTFLTLLDAQRTYQQTRVALVQAQAERYADTAALFVALGGGWQGNPDQPRPDQPRSDQPKKAETKKEDAR